MGLIKWAIVLAIGIFIGMGFASANLNDDLFSYYKMDAPSGAVVDELENYNGTNNGATRGVSGIIDDAFDFDGSSDYVDAFGSPLLTNDFSVGVWIYKDSLSGTDYGVTQATSDYGHYRFSINTIGNKLQIRQSRDGSSADEDGTTSLSTGTWYYIVMVSNSTGWTAYINGALEMAHLNSDSFTNTDNQGLVLGVEWWDDEEHDNWWDGKLDEIGFWERALTEAEIVLLYNSGAGVTYPFDGLVTLNSPVDEFISPTQSVTFNASATALSSTLANMTLWHNASGTWLANETFTYPTSYANIGTISDMSILYPACDAEAENTIIDNYVSEVNMTCGLSNPTRQWICGVKFYYEDGTTYTTPTQTANTYSSAINFLNLYPTKKVDNVTATLSASSCVNPSSFFAEDIIIYSTFFTEYTQIWTETFTDGATWGVEACDTTSCFFSQENRSFIVDTSLPTILIDYPVNGSLLNSIKENGGNQTIEITITDTNLDTCWTNYNGVNTTFGTGGTCNDFNLSLENVGTLPWHELTIWANDTAGNANSNYTTWEYNAFVTNQTWNAVAQEGAVENFTLNTTLGTGLTFSSATLNYNGTAYGGTITSTGGTDYYVSRTIDILNVDVTEEHDFYWTLTLSNGNSYNTTTQTQNVTSLVIDDCTLYSTLILNYTLYDEDTQIIIPNTGENATIEVSVEISPLGSTTPIITYANTFESNNATICLDELDTNYRLDVTARYSAFDHVVEFHHIQNWQLNSSSAQHISLYDLLITESQEFLVIFKDDNFVLVPDALIDVSREYVGDGVFKSVEVAKTDSQGQTIVHLVLSDVRYDVVVKKEGEILASFDNVVAVCQDVSSGECTLNLNELATHIEPLDYEHIGNIAYYWTLDRNARTIQVDFTSVDSLVVRIDLNVTKFDNFFNDSVCSETLTSTTGTITCSIPASFGNVSFLAELYSTDPDENLVFVGQTLFSLSPSALESFGLAGVIMVIIMFMVLPMMFISSPIGMVFGGIIAIIMMSLLQMFDYGGTFIGGGSLGNVSMIVWFVIAGLILVWRISKGGNQ